MIGSSASLVMLNDVFLEQIIKILGNPNSSFSNNYNCKLSDETKEQVLYLSLKILEQTATAKTTNLVSVQTSNGYFELHGFSRVVPIEPDEVAFLSIDEEKSSCMIVGRNCTCRPFSNINKNLIRTNFAELDNELLLSAMQLALFEDLL
ncbi:MAG: hypothetical protein ACUVQ1_06060 [Candidatus Kapaibacteriales bacterium]